MGFLLGILLGAIGFQCVSLFISSGKCEPCQTTEKENCCQNKRWLYLLPIIIIVLLLIGFFMMRFGFMPYGMGMPGGMGRNCWY